MSPQNLCNMSEAEQSIQGFARHDCGVLFLCLYRSNLFLWFAIHPSHVICWGAGPVELEIYFVADGSSLVRKHIPVVRSGEQFPSDLRASLDDRLCRVVEYLVVDE